MLNVALPKGRMGEEVLDLLKQAGCQSSLLAKDSRKLVMEDPQSGMRYFWVKPSDVAVYVLHGAADLGVVGKDVLLETHPDVYELLDLGLGVCRMVVAGPEGFTKPVGKLRVATKYPGITQRYYAGQNQDIELIALNGSIELAPIVGLSDVFVDIVQTGSTLADNNMRILEEIMPMSARLIVNIASYKFKHDDIRRMMEALNRV